MISLERVTHRLMCQRALLLLVIFQFLLSAFSLISWRWLRKEYTQYYALHLVWHFVKVRSRWTFIHRARSCTPAIGEQMNASTMCSRSEWYADCAFYHFLQHKLKWTRSDDVCTWCDGSDTVRDHTFTFADMNDLRQCLLFVWIFHWKSLLLSSSVPYVRSPRSMRQTHHLRNESHTIRPNDILKK